MQRQRSWKHYDYRTSRTGRSGVEQSRQHCRDRLHAIGLRWLRSETSHGRCGWQYFHSLKPSRRGNRAANLLALNFMLYDILAGGASQSLRIDTQGKTLALTLLHAAAAHRRYSLHVAPQGEYSP